MKKLASSVILWAFLPILVCAQTTTFTYQGSLKDGGNPANGNYDFEFALYDALSSGNQLGSTLSRPNVAVTNGVFAVTLDFGSQFPGANRFLEIRVRPAGQPGITILGPRQHIASTPYAIKSVTSESANTAENALQLGGVAANQFVLTGDARLSDARNPLPGSTNYIQNTMTQQASSNFNISGNGIVGGTLSVGNAGTSARLYLNRASTAPSNSADINFFSAGTPDFSLGTSQGSADPADFSVYNYGTSSNALTIKRSNSFIGFGTNAPNTHFHMLANAPQRFAIQMENTDTAKRLYIGNYGTVGGGNHWPGLDSANTSFLYAENPLVFTTPAGIFFSGSTTAEHMRITTDGRVGIGTTSPATKLHVVGTNTAVWGQGTDAVGVYGSSTNSIGVDGGSVNYYGVFGSSTSSHGVHGLSTSSYGVYATSVQSYAGYFEGNVYVTGTVTQNSDARLKHGVSKLGYGLPEVLRLRPVTWRWKDHPERGPQLGLVAQEVEPVLPELVSTGKDADQTKGLNYIGLVPVLVKALQEQQQQLDQQQAHISNQQQQLEQYRMQLAQQQARDRQQQIELATLKRLLCRQFPKTTVCRASHRAKGN